MGGEPRAGRRLHILRGRLISTGICRSVRKRNRQRLGGTVGGRQGRVRQNKSEKITPSGSKCRVPAAPIDWAPEIPSTNGIAGATPGKCELAHTAMMNYFCSPRNHVGRLTQPSWNRCWVRIAPKTRRKGAFRAPNSGWVNGFTSESASLVCRSHNMRFKRSRAACTRCGFAGPTGSGTYPGTVAASLPEAALDEYRSDLSYVDRAAG
jgi:hypothetical protein